MILINLLPHREAARKKRREFFFMQVGLAFLVGGLVSGGVFSWYSARLSRQHTRNDFIKSEIAKLDAQIKEVANLQSMLDALKARQAAVETLQADRNTPVHLLDEMVKQLPDGVYLTSLKQNGLVVTLTGVAQSQERVSELLRNLGNHSEWLDKPQLVEIVAADINVPQRGPRRVSNFTMRVDLKRPDGKDAETAPGPGATKPAGPAAPKPGGKA